MLHKKQWLVFNDRKDHMELFDSQKDAADYAKEMSAAYWDTYFVSEIIGVIKYKSEYEKVGV